MSLLTTDRERPTGRRHGGPACAPARSSPSACQPRHSALAAVRPTERLPAQPSCHSAGAPGARAAGRHHRPHARPGSAARVVPRRQVPDPAARHLRPRSQARSGQRGRGPARDRGGIRPRPRCRGSGPHPRRAHAHARADHRRDRRPRSARAAAPRREHHRGDGQRPAPGLHRALAARSS